MFALDPEMDELREENALNKRRINAIIEALAPTVRARVEKKLETEEANAMQTTNTTDTLKATLFTIAIIWCVVFGALCMQHNVRDVFGFAVLALLFFAGSFFSKEIKNFYSQ